MDRLIGPIRDGPHPRRDGLKNRERTNRLLIALGLRLARSRLDDDTDAAKALLEDASRNLDEAIRELRELARGIHPAVLTDPGLGFALEALAQRMPLPIEVGAVPRERLPDRVDAAACYVVAEAITNVARCAHASHARVDVRCDANRLVVEVADDGVGGADPGKGSGLRGLGDRIAALDGRLDVASEAGRGTTVRALIPI